VIEFWGNLNNEELFTFDCSSHGLRLMKSGRTGWQLRRVMCGRRFWQDTVKERDHHSGQHVDSNTTELQNVKRSHLSGDMDQWLALMTRITKLVFTKYTEFLG
jgi:hypothetical protein